MTEEQQIDKAVLFSMIPHIVKANEQGLDADALAYLSSKEQRLRAKAKKQLSQKRKLRIVGD